MLIVLYCLFALIVMFVSLVFLIRDNPRDKVGNLGVATLHGIIWPVTIVICVLWFVAGQFYNMAEKLADFDVKDYLKKNLENKS